MQTDDRPIAQTAEAGAFGRQMTWRRIAGFRLVTADLDRATRFYAALGFSVGAREPIGRNEMAMLGLSGGGLRQNFKLGQSDLALDQYEDAGRPYPIGASAAAPIFQHFALETLDTAASWARAQAAGAIPISLGGPVALPASAGGVIAVKFRDPDGHPLEIIQFPNRTDCGPGLIEINHTAISVRDISVSRSFFSERGLKPAHGSLNLGETQERLDDLQGVEVDVAPMNPSERPPHLELLGYRRPLEAPISTVRLNDIAATRIVWSAGASMLVRDPDGHLHQLER